MKLIILFACFLTLISCSVRKAGGAITTEEGYEYYVQSAPPLRIQLYGDYRFHPVSKKHFTDVGKSFLNYTGTRLQGTRPQLMYAAHTVVQPYYSTVGTLYKNTSVDASLLNNVKEEVKDRLGASINRVDTVETVYGTATRLHYQVLNPVTKIRSSHWEYLVSNQRNALRIFFWTTNNDTGFIFEETEEIAKNVRE